MAREKTTHI